MEVAQFKKRVLACWTLLVPMQNGFFVIFLDRQPDGPRFSEKHVVGTYFDKGLDPAEVKTRAEKWAVDNLAGLEWVNERSKRDVA